MNYLERARVFFRNDHYATDATGIVIEKAEDGYSEISLKLDTRHKNGIGQVMGAVYSTMVDFISFMNACRGDRLYASCRCTQEGGRTCFYDVHVKDNMGTEIVQATVTGYKLSPNFTHPMEEGEDPYREQQLLLDRATKK